MNTIWGVSLYLLTEIVNYILIYAIVFGAHITKRISGLLIGLGMIFGSQLLVFCFISQEISFEMTVVTMIMIPLIMLEKRKREYFILYPFVLSLASIVGVVSAFGLSYVLEKSIDLIIKTGREYMFCQLMQMTFLVLVYLVKMARREEWCETRFRVPHYIVFNLVAFVAFVGVGAIQTLCGNGIYNKEAAVSGLAISIADVIMMIAVILMGMTQELRLEAENKIYFSEQMALVQKEHYERLIVKDDLLRKFRHDVRAHLTVLRSYIDNKDYESVSKYIGQIEEETQLTGRSETTGNRIIDAIIESFNQDYEQNQITVKVNGIFGQNKPECDMELGIIVYNLLKNAVEACVYIEDINNRYININVGTFGEKKLLKISNSSNGKYKLYKDELLTTKQDTYRHGYGTVNVKRAVKKCGGDIEYNFDKDNFEVTVVI